MGTRQRAQDDATAMYYNALRWYISGDESHAQCAVRIANAWSATVSEAPYGDDLSGIPIGSSLVRDGKVIASGHNKRVQDGDPITHAEIDCLRNAGRIPGNFRGATLYSTLMPCFLCSGAAVQFGVARVVVGESRNFAGAPEFMRAHGIEVIDLDLPECVQMMADFIRDEPDLWDEDIGV